MASTTTNLGLTKPAYSDDADISDINGNMDLIDAEAGRVRANVAANYDSSETYAVGDYCLHDGSLYKCTTAISSPEAWTAGHWTQIKITGELSALNGNITTLSDQIGNIKNINLAYNSSYSTVQTRIQKAIDDNEFIENKVNIGSISPSGYGCYMIFPYKSGGSWYGAGMVAYSTNIYQVRISANTVTATALASAT